jgi:DNA-binding NtrC family response regulator
MAATENDLEAATAEGRLHEELFYRLSAFELRVPPLRERREEIPLLLGHMMSRLTRRYGVPAPRLSGTLLDACQRYCWPGNLRELENFAKRYLARTDEEAAVRELQESPGYGTDAKNGNGGNGKTAAPAGSGHNGEERSSLRSLVRTAKWEAERAAIAGALEETHWNRKAAARLLNVSYRALLYKIQEYHLVPPADSLSRIFGGNGVEAKSAK